jgi:hypothetical protein
MRTLSVSRALALATLSACAIAAATAAEVTPSAFLSDVAGVYKEQIPRSLSAGEQQAENILEVVPVDDGHAYIRMQIDSYKGYMGAIYGVASFKGPKTLVYDNGKSGGEKCSLQLNWSKKSVSIVTDFQKTPGCRDFHGTRGAADEISFLVARKRDIPDLPHLKDSREFHAAMDEYRARAPQ